jgi:acetyltransferase-like isoleucine patch superfamily enzyme
VEKEWRLFEFLQKKIRHMSFGELLFSQAEAFAFWLVGGLPGAPGFALRWFAYRILFARLGGFCWVQPGVTIVQSNRLSVGKHFGCNSGTYINAIGRITMGDYVLLGSNVTISSGMHPIDGAFPPIFARPVVPQPIAIEDDVWIAAGAVILPGVTLRRGTVIGANAVVSSDTEEYGVYVGAPAKKSRSRNESDIRP